MFSAKTVLFATDFSPTSEAAFGLACALSRDYGAKLVIQHVVMPPSALAYREMVLRGDLNEGFDAIERKLHAVRPIDSGIAVEHRLTQGDAAQEILRLAEEVKADLVIMGTHGRTGLGRLMGSVAEKVVRQAPCPVLTLKAAVPAPNAVKARQAVVQCQN
jgi:universal stress protein A